jgi:hypothetical protein
MQLFLVAYYHSSQEDTIIRLISDNLERCKSVAQQISNEDQFYVYVYPFETDNVYDDLFDNEAVVCYKRGEEV